MSQAIKACAENGGYVLLSRNKQLDENKEIHNSSWDLYQ